MFHKSTDSTIASVGPALAIKFAPPSAQGVIEGLASTFGGDPDSYGDVIAPGAFRKSLADHRAARTLPAMLWSHDQKQPIGKWLEIREDAVGLRVTGKLTLEVPRAREAFALAQDGALGLSIGFLTVDAGRTPAGHRLLKALKLAEISLVALPANTAALITSVKQAPAAHEIDNPRAFEKFLRDAGFPREFSKAILSRGYKAAAGLRDADDSVSTIARSIRAKANAIRNITKD